MGPGIFTTVFPRPTLDETFAAVADRGIGAVQFDLENAGLPTLPDAIPEDLPARIQATSLRHAVAISALSGTFNMAHPDAVVRRQDLGRFRVLAAACRPMGASVITICTGTRNRDSMWQHHSENESPEAWADLLAGLEVALEIADDHNITLAFEPEPANIARNAARARALLDEVRHPRLAVVLDPANILAGAMDPPPDEVLAEAFDLLGDHIVATHAKDIDADGVFCAAGRGIVPWDVHVRLLHQLGFDGPLVLHTLTEDEVPSCLAVLDRALDRAGVADVSS